MSSIVLLCEFYHCAINGAVISDFSSCVPIEERARRGERISSKGIGGECIREFLTEEAVSQLMITIYRTKIEPPGAEALFLCRGEKWYLCQSCGFPRNT